MSRIDREDELSITVVPGRATLEAAIRHLRSAGVDPMSFRHGLASKAGLDPETVAAIIAEVQ